MFAVVFAEVSNHAVEVVGCASVLREHALEKPADAVADKVGVCFRGMDGKSALRKGEVRCRSEVGDGV